jgi:hypothetical protein
VRETALALQGLLSYLPGRAFAISRLDEWHDPSSSKARLYGVVDFFVVVVFEVTGRVF